MCCVANTFCWFPAISTRKWWRSRRSVRESRGGRSLRVQRNIWRRDRRSIGRISFRSRRKRRSIGRISLRSRWKRRSRGRSRRERRRRIQRCRGKRRRRRRSSRISTLCRIRSIRRRWWRRGIIISSFPSFA